MIEDLRDILTDFTINLLLIVAIGFFLFYTHSFAGGDCKLSIVLALLYPGRFYVAVSGTIYTLYFAMGFAIILGYVYLLARSTWKIIAKKNSLEFSYVKNYLFGFAKSFLVVTIYISGVNLLTALIARFGLEVNPWISRVVCLIIAWLVGKNKWMKKPLLVGIIFIIDILLVSIIKMIPISINPSNYALAVVLLACQMTISTDLYDEIAITDLREGMILSTISSVLMQGSRVRGLPGVSSEDLRDRLTVQEVENVKRWAKDKNIENVTVVHKIPFAAFLVVGYITYFIIWSIRN